MNKTTFKNEKNPQQTIFLRPESPDDLDFLFEVYASTRTEELAVTQWDQTSKDTFLKMQFAAQRQGYQTRFPNAEFLVILLEQARAGRIVIDRRDKEIRLVDIAFLPAFRRHGVGRTIVNALIEEARQTQKPLTVSVFKWGDSAGFYQNMGFVRTQEADMFDVWAWQPPDAVAAIQSNPGKF